MAPAARRRDLGMDMLRGVDHRLVELRQVGRVGNDALDHGIGYHRSGVVAHHAAAVARARPLGQQRILARHVGQSGLNLGVDRGVDQVEQREEAAERIPEAGIGVEITRTHLAVVGAVVDGIPRGVDFVELAREERRAVEARIEGAHLLVAAPLDADAAQDVVPALLRLGRHRLEVVTAQLALEVAHGLLGGDERRGDAHVDLLAAPRGEVHLGHGMLPLDALAALGIEHAAARLVVRRRVGQLDAREGLVEAQDEVVAEVVGHAAAVARRIAGQRVVVDHLDARPAVEGVDHHARLLRFGEGKTQDGGPLGGGHLGLDVVVGQVDRVVVGTRLLGLVREPALARLLVQLVVAAHGHHRELAVVINPRRGLMRLLEAPERMGPVGVGPPVTHAARLGRPEVHAPRQGDGRIGVAGRQRIVGLRPDERRDILRRADNLLRAPRRSAAGGCSHCEHRKCPEDDFHRQMSIRLAFIQSSYHTFGSEPISNSSTPPRASDSKSMQGLSYSSPLNRTLWM